jgi:DNA end-binding protein Ku
MPRAIWKGAVTFGLVYIPVELYSASRSNTLDLDLLDRRDFAPVGYQRVNKETGEVVDWGDIVKGYQYKKGQYVALSDEDFRRANVKASQTIEIDSFTEAAAIAPEFYETPYYLAPAKGGDKPYVLLREVLRKGGKVAVGSLVMRGRQHLGVIIPAERILMLLTLRFEDELRRPSELSPVPATARAAKVSAREVAMAERLVEEMTSLWDPGQYRDSYRDDLMKRIREKIRKKQTHLLTPKEKTPKEERRSAEIIDLMSVLRKSIESHGKAPARASRKRSSAGRRQGRG